MLHSKDTSSSLLYIFFSVLLLSPLRLLCDKGQVSYYSEKGFQDAKIVDPKLFAPPLLETG